MRRACIDQASAPVDPLYGAHPGVVTRQPKAWITRTATGLSCALVTILCVAATPDRGGARLVRWDGVPVTLSDAARGRATAVLVIKGHWCPACRAQLVSSNSDLERIRTVGEVIGVSTEPWTTHREVRRALRLDYDLLSDPRAELLTPLGFFPAGAPHPTPGIIFLDA